jgi:hypothetical protein
MMGSWLMNDFGRRSIPVADAMNAAEIGLAGINPRVVR